jgi:hypothetical protein
MAPPPMPGGELGAGARTPGGVSPGPKMPDEGPGLLLVAGGMPAPTDEPPVTDPGAVPKLF